MQIKTEKTERGMVKRGPGGRFAKGTAPGPGRPRSTLDFRKTIEQQAFLDDDYDLEAALYRVFKKQIERAEGGNLEAARFVTERLAGVLELPERAPKVAVQVNAGRFGGPRRAAWRQPRSGAPYSRASAGSGDEIGLFIVPCCARGGVLAALARTRG